MHNASKNRAFVACVCTWRSYVPPTVLTIAVRRALPRYRVQLTRQAAGQE